MLSLHQCQKEASHISPLPFLNKLPCKSTVNNIQTQQFRSTSTKIGNQKLNEKKYAIHNQNCFDGVIEPKYWYSYLASTCNLPPKTARDSFNRPRKSLQAAFLLSIESYKRRYSLLKCALEKERQVIITMHFKDT